MFFSPGSLLFLMVVTKSVVADFWGFSSCWTFKKYYCSRDSLVVLRKGVLPWVKTMYIDGQYIPFQDSDTYIRPSNSVLAVQLKPGLTSLINTLLPLAPFVSNFSCTPDQLSGLTWTQPSYNYGGWPYFGTPPTSIINLTLSYLKATNFILANIRNVLTCRFHLICGGGGYTTTTTTTTAAPTTKTSTTASTTASSTSSSTTTTTTLAPTTSTTTASSGGSGTTAVPPGPPHCVAFGDNLIKAGTQIPLKCQCTANPPATSSQWSFGSQSFGSPNVQLDNTAQGWYLTSYTPSKPWDFFTIGLYTCAVTSLQGTDSANVYATVANAVCDPSASDPQCTYPVSSSFNFTFQVSTCNGFAIFATDGPTDDTTAYSIQLTTDSGFTHFTIVTPDGTNIPSSGWPSSCDSSDPIWLWISFDSLTSTLSIGDGTTPLQSTQVSYVFSSAPINYLTFSAITEGIIYYIYP